MKYIVTTIFVLLAFQSFGQFTKGDKVLGGTMSLLHQQRPDISLETTSFNIAPNVGILLNEKLELGVGVGYLWRENELGPDFYSRDREISAGIYAQRYFVLADRFLFSLVGSTRFIFGNKLNKTTNTATNEVTETENSGNGLEISLTPRFLFFPSPNWALQAGIGNIRYTNSDSIFPYDTFNFEYGTISLGLAYYFRK